MQSLPSTKKSLGQHWLTDTTALTSIAESADVNSDDVVLEIGPGAGTLTEILVNKAAKVVAVEFDEVLARDLPLRVRADNLEIIQKDILRFDLSSLPEAYKVVANIPYYLTSKLIRVLSESSNPPSTAVILVQKEVAERVAAAPGEMSILSVTAQYYWQTSLGVVIPSALFTPPPKVDSQVLIMQSRTEPLFDDVDTQSFFRLVKAGFSSRRKTVSNALSGGLRITKLEAATALETAGINPGARAQSLSLEEWNNLYQVMNETSSYLTR